MIEPQRRGIARLISVSMLRREITRPTDAQRCLFFSINHIGSIPMHLLHTALCSRLSLSASALPLLGALLGAAACASSSATMQKLEDGSYRLECQSKLSACLRQVEDPCASYGYEVLNGRQEVRAFGPEQLQSTYVNSEAVVMCRNANGLIDDTPQPGGASSSENEASTVAGAPAAPLCVPGSTQSCVGPAGCGGGQKCAPDGSAYLDCDCGSSTPTVLAPNPMATSEGAASSQTEQPAPAPTINTSAGPTEPAAGATQAPAPVSPPAPASPPAP